VLSDTDRIRASDVERELGHAAGGGAHTAAAASPADGVPRPDGPGKPRTGGAEDVGLSLLSLDGQRRETEREALVRALARAGNNRTQAARLLEVSRRTLYNKLKEHGVA
jgi:two-component system response regulator AtoC